MTQNSFVDLVFSVHAPEPVPLDHGYPLFSALVSKLPWIHEQPGIGVFPLEGKPLSSEALDIREGTLRIRCRSEQVGELMALSNAEIEILGRHVRLGVPTGHPLRAAPELSSRVVIIKGFKHGAGFVGAAHRQLEALGCRGRIVVGRRRIVRIAGRKVVGFGVRVIGLTEEGSRTLQAVGLGGRRHMGCGLFLPKSSHSKAIPS